MRSREGALREATPTTFEDLSDAELYDLAADIGETTNLATTHPTVARELAAEWQRWNRELTKPLWPPPARGGGAFQNQR